jgi:translation initiation factor IF-1
VPEGQRAPEGALEADGRVLESLPNALFLVEILTEKRRTVTAHVSGSSSLLRVRPGDEVVVEIMPYDPTRGRILRRRG